nr:immunoglobulin light chain junction region [Macaca mulatta]MOW66041.1 immunoglobulin light chain junction region [Macaca mulatta]
CLQDVEIPPTF